MRLYVVLLSAFLSLGLLVGCTSKRAENPPVKDQVKQALDQKNLGDITVDEDRDKGVITLKGNAKDDATRQQAAEVAQAAAPGRVVANEIAVRPVGEEGTAKKIESNTDDAIEHSFKAEAAAHRLDKQSIHAKATNGVLTLTGKVDTPRERAEAEKVGAQIAGVRQVVNELQVKGGKAVASEERQ